MVRKRFGVLRVVATIFKILAWVVLVMGILGACGVIAMGVMSSNSAVTNLSRTAGLGSTGSILAAVGTGLGLIFGAILYFVLMYATGDFIYLLLALEENTRLTAERLQAGAPVAASPVPPAIPAPR